MTDDKLDVATGVGPALGFLHLRPIAWPGLFFAGAAAFGARPPQRVFDQEHASDAPREIVGSGAGRVARMGAERPERTALSTTKINAPLAGRPTPRVDAGDAGVVLDKITIDAGGLQPSYLGPKETVRPPTTNQQ